MKNINIELPTRPQFKTRNVVARLTLDEFNRFEEFCIKNKVTKAAMMRSLITSLIQS
jgi:hypothetical protein